MLLFLSCTIFETANDPCELYTGQSAQYCTMKLIEQSQSIDSGERICRESGEWEEECRYEWVSRFKLNKSYSFEQLYEFCGTSDDCRFELLEHRPQKLAVQLGLCGELHVPNYRQDCARFALQRWRSSNPSAAEIKDFASSLNPRAQDSFFKEQMELIGVFVYCDQQLLCTDVSDPSQCHRAVQRQRKRRCPSKEPARPWTWSISHSDAVQFH